MNLYNALLTAIQNHEPITISSLEKILCIDQYTIEPVIKQLICDGRIHNIFENTCCDNKRNCTGCNKLTSPVYVIQ